MEERVRFNHDMILTWIYKNDLTGHYGENITHCSDSIQFIQAIEQFMSEEHSDCLEIKKGREIKW